MRIHSLSAALAATLLAAPLSVQAADVPGYGSQDAASVAAMPVDVVLGPARIDPQIGYGGMSIGITSNGRYPGMTLGQTAGANIAGGLIASAIITAAIRADARDQARTLRARLVSEGCSLDIEHPLGDALKSAIVAAWPGAKVRVQLAPTANGASKLLDAAAPRYVFQVASGIAPDESALVTTIDADAYPASANSPHAASDPAWHDSIILVSDAYRVPPKSQADIDSEVARENARFDALNLGPTITMLNKDASEDDPLRHRDEYKRVKAAIDDHNHNLMLARIRFWQPQEHVRMFTDALVANHCERIDQAVAQTASLIGDSIAALAAGQLPPRLSRGAKTDLKETDGTRAIQPLPGGIFVSRRGGDDTPLDFRYEYLDPDKGAGGAKQ